MSELKVGDKVFIPATITKIVQNEGRHPWKCYYVDYVVNDSTAELHLIKSEFVVKP